MDRRTLLAIVLSIVVVFGGFYLQGIFFPTSSTQNSAATTPQKQDPVAAQATTSTLLLADALEVVASESFDVQTDLIKVTFDNVGAVVKSLEIKKHLDNGKPVQMINPKWGKGAAFETAFGSIDAKSLDVPFKVSKKDGSVVEFSRVFLDKKGVPFTYKKTFTIKPNEYLIKLDITIEGSNGGLPVLSDEQFAYTLTFGPQIGASFEKLDGTQEYRKYYRFDGNNRPEESLNNETKFSDANFKWSAVVGKYFTVIGIPDSTSYRSIFSNKRGAQDKEVSRLSFSRPVIKSTTTVDSFYFYVGPKEENTLKKYNEAETNAFGLSGLKLERAMEDNFLLGWLEFILKAALVWFHSLIPNWGISIIILTIIIKLLTWPLTAKSYRATAAMQSLQPKLKELQEKYKEDPKKLNEMTMGLYQKEGVNPLGGCLPMLLQIPIFFALYSMFSNQFDLRGAMFIPGWIPDLSVPDKLPFLDWGFPIPLLNWTAIHLLPLIMVGTQVWTSMLSQPAGGSTTQMKIMTYGIPVIFLFMLYSMPSGLMVYWCVQNIVQVAQQVYINKHFKKAPPSPNLKLVKKGRK